MAKQATLPLSTVDQMLKALLVAGRAVENVLETHAVQSAVEEPLSLSKVQILRLLTEKRQQNSSQVARFLGVSKPAVTQIVDAMVQADMLVRKPAKADRREVGLELTKVGKATFQAVRKRQRHIVRSAVRNITEAEVGRWVTALQSVSSGLASADRAFEQMCLQCGAHSDTTCVLVGGEANCVFEQHNAKVSKRRVLRKSRA